MNMKKVENKLKHALYDIVESNYIDKETSSHWARINGSFQALELIQQNKQADNVLLSSKYDILFAQELTEHIRDIVEPVIFIITHDDDDYGSSIVLATLDEGFAVEKLNEFNNTDDEKDAHNMTQIRLEKRNVIIDADPL